jgi:molybdate/tungstate transport system substrate-binding protein
MQLHTYRFNTFAKKMGMHSRSLILKLIFPCLFGFLLLSATGFSQSGSQLSGNLVIFHAGSLSVPLKEVADEFKKLHPKVNIMMEAGGSVASARKITDLDKQCDIMASADYAVIDKMLIPKYADYNIKFASNELCVVYSEKSRYAKQINEKNWMDILLKSDVAYGRSDPNSDPCGYRTEMTLQLAEKHYKKIGLYSKFIAKDKAYIRPKETDLLALIETNTIDYIFLYRSVAVQHKLNYIVLPDAINLKNPAFVSQYSIAKVEINGSKPGEKQTMTGEPMIYSFTILRNAPNKSVAIAFAEFLLQKDKGQAIMARNGQPSVVPMKIENYDKVPVKLKPFVKK